MKIIKNIILWIIVGFLAIIALVSIPSFSCLTTMIIILLISPIDRWQNFLHKYIHGKIKIIALIVLVILMFVTFPDSDTSIDVDTPHETTTASTTESAVASTSESANASTTKSTTSPTAESTTAPTAESTTVPTTASTAAPTAESTTVPTTASTAAPTTESTTAPTTVPTTESTTASTTEPPHEHSYSEATCTTPRTCSCGVTEGEPNGHSWKEATYTSPKTCTVCGATDGNSLDMPGKENYHGHVYTGGESSKKYHYEPDCAGKYSHEITWEEVTRRGLEPCGTCVLQ